VTIRVLTADDTVTWAPEEEFTEQGEGLYIWKRTPVPGVKQVWRIFENGVPVLQVRVLISMKQVDYVR
jgi:hypothetical protein